MESTTNFQQKFEDVIRKKANYLSSYRSKLQANAKFTKNCMDARKCKEELHETKMACESLQADLASLEKADNEFDDKLVSSLNVTSDFEEEIELKAEIQQFKEEISKEKLELHRHLRKQIENCHYTIRQHIATNNQLKFENYEQSTHTVTGLSTSYCQDEAPTEKTC